LPAPWQDKLGTAGISRLLLVKLFREEKTVFAAQAFVAAQLGKQFTEPAPWTLEDVFPDTSARTPVIFILSTGGQHFCLRSTCN
jgi:dynein heavy chain